MRVLKPRTFSSTGRLSTIIAIEMLTDSSPPSLASVPLDVSSPPSAVPPQAAASSAIATSREIINRRSLDPLAITPSVGAISLYETVHHLVIRNLHPRRHRVKNRGNRAPPVDAQPRRSPGSGAQSVRVSNRRG